MGLSSGKCGLKTVRRISYRDFVKEELEIASGRAAQGTLEQMEICLKHFGAICHPNTVADINTAMVEQFYSRRLREVARATANKELRHLKACFGRAVMRGYMSRNAASAVKPAKEAEKAVRVLTGEEIGKLLSACPSAGWRALVAMAVCTGMRRGEFLALRWEDVDLDGQSVCIRNTPDHETKSRKNRAVPLTPELCTLLRRLRPKTVCRMPSGALSCRPASPIARSTICGGRSSAIWQWLGSTQR